MKWWTEIAWDHDELIVSAECCFVWIMLLQLIFFFADIHSLALASLNAGILGVLDLHILHYSSFTVFVCVSVNFCGHIFIPTDFQISVFSTPLYPAF